MGRAPCCDKEGLKKGPWTQEEDLLLTQYIDIHGPGNWRNLPKRAGLKRCGKSCRLRWANYLRPDIKRGRFSFEEEEIIIQLHSVLGNKWSAIAARLPGRTDNEIKNYWNTHIRKRLLRMGIDPVTHSPRLDLYHNLSKLISSAICNSSQLNLVQLLALNQQPVNPEQLNLATAIMSLKQQNPNTFSQDTQVQSHPQNQLPASQSSDYSFLNQALTVDQKQPLQACFDLLSDNQENNMDLPSTISPGMQIFGLEPPSNSSGNVVSMNETNSGVDTTMHPGSSEKRSSSNSLHNESQEFHCDSVLSSPMSSPSTAYLSNGAAHCNSDGYCSNFFNFEIPELFDISYII